MVLMLTALALVPAGTHLLALPNKIGLPQDQYFIVQGIYRGWAFLGAVLMAAIVADLAAMYMSRPATGRYRRPTGKHCAGSGNIPTPSMPV
jgi:hypothetical protein